MTNGHDLELEQIRLKRMKQLLIKSPKTTIENAQHDDVPTGIIQLTDRNFDLYLNEYSNIPMLIDYWADWCQPCKKISPIVEALERKYRKKMIFGKINIDHNPHTSQKYGIRSIPAFNIFYQGQIIDSFVGAIPGHQFETKIINALKKTGRMI